VVVWEGLTDLVPETGLTEPMPWSIEQASAYWQDQERVEYLGGIIETGSAEKAQRGTWMTLVLTWLVAEPPEELEAARIKV